MLKDYVALDLETTGLNPKTDRILEIGAARIRDGKVSETFETFVNPHMGIGEHVRALTGICRSQVDEAPDLEVILKPLREFLGTDVLLGHRILFDYSFLKIAYVNAGLPFEKAGMDTLKLARMCLPDLPSRKLPDLCSYYGIDTVSHRALSDSLAAYELYCRLCGDYREADAALPVPLLCKVRKEGPITRSQIEQLSRLLREYHISWDGDISYLTRNEASRMIDRIRSGDMK